MTRAEIINQCATFAGVCAGDFDLEAVADIILEDYPEANSIDDIDIDAFTYIMESNCIQ